MAGFIDLLSLMGLWFPKPTVVPTLEPLLNFVVTARTVDFTVTTSTLDFVVTR